MDGYTTHNIAIVEVESGKRFAQCDCAWGTPIVDFDKAKGLIFDHLVRAGQIHGDL